MSDNNGDSVLHYAVKGHQLDAVTSLVSGGVDLNKQDSDGYTPLHWAVKLKYKDVVKILLDIKGNNILEVNQRNKHFSTPLFIACANGATDIVELLLGKTGTDTNLAEKDGLTPLHTACRYGHTYIVELLLRQSATKINLPNNDNWTPLHIACRSGHTGIIELLLKQSAIKVNLANNDNWTPLHFACGGGHTGIIELLLKRTDINVNLLTNNGDTPLHLAVERQHYDVVSIMLSQRSVKLDLRNCKGITPLLEAVSLGHMRILDKIVLNTADMNAVDDDGNNCVHIAAEKEMFSSEVEPMAILDEYCTKLELSLECRLKSPVVICYLANHGANLYCKNKKNVTALDLIKNADLREKIKALFPPQPSSTSPPPPPPPPPSPSPTPQPPQPPQCMIGAEVNEPTMECQQSGHTEIVSRKLEEKDLLKVARQLGSNWWQVGLFLRIESARLDIIRRKYPLDDEEQSFKMLHFWFTHCEPENRTVNTLRRALTEAECFHALKYLPSDVQ